MEMSSYVQTVQGPVAPSSLGFTLTHEHLSMEFQHFYREPPAKLANIMSSKPTLATVGYLRQYPYSSEYNLILNDIDAKEAVIADLLDYKECGGGTIVENSTIGLGGKLSTYFEMSQTTDVNIVAGTGYYIEDTQPEDSLYCTVEDLANTMKNDLTLGYKKNETNIKAGFVGEIASVWPIRDFERKVIKAAAEVQQETGCGVSFHPHRHPEAPHEIIRIYLEAGGAPNKAVMSHLDRTLIQKEQLLEFSKLGTYCQFDLFGIEVSYYQLNIDTDMPSDAQRINMIESLLEEGKEERILMSHDIHTKHRLRKFGGHGYSHIINNVLPKMQHKGISIEVIDKITKENPARWLTIKK